jgi:type II restriction enzyme
MEAGIYFPLFIVLTTTDRRRRSVFYLPADLQESKLFEPRSPLSTNAKRAGWQGFLIRLDRAGIHAPVRVL